MSHRILLIEDDPGVREATTFVLREDGHDVTVAVSGEAARALLDDANTYDVVLTDLRMPGMSGIDVIREFRSRKDDTPVIVFTAYGTVEKAMEAMRAGAADFLEKPLSRETLRIRLNQVLATRALVEENARLRESIKNGASRSSIIAVSEPMQRVLTTVDRVASTDATVLIQGESGTGKELIARRLHERSSRRVRAFVALNCAALPRELLEAELFGYERGAFTGAAKARRGKFVEADGGTIFLDEIGDLDLSLQVKLLRVLQERVVDVVGGRSMPIDVRVVTATHQDLRARIRDGLFREDLYFRLHVVPVVVPPLRERKDDIAPLFRAFVAEAAAQLHREVPRIDDALLHDLRERNWPGNVRELENVAMRLVAEHGDDTLLSSSLAVDAGRSMRAPTTVKASGAPLSVGAELVLDDGGVALRALERAAIVAALRKTEGNRSAAARFLDVPRHVLLYRMEKFAIQDDELVPSGEARAPVVAVTAPFEEDRS